MRSNASRSVFAIAVVIAVAHHHLTDSGKFLPTAFERRFQKMTNTPNMKPESDSSKEEKPAVGSPQHDTPKPQDAQKANPGHQNPEPKPAPKS